jgi:hypothetical protein
MKCAFVRIHVSLHMFLNAFGEYVGTLCTPHGSRRGLFRFKLHDYKATIEACDKAIKLDPACVKAYFRKGMAYSEQTRFEEVCFLFSSVAPMPCLLHTVF